MVQKEKGNEAKTMDWIKILLITTASIVAAGILVKVILHYKLQSIDGLGGVHIENRSMYSEKIIGHFGEYEERGKRK